MYMHVIKSFLIKLKTQKYHTVTTTAKSNTEIVGRDKIDILNTQVHDCSLSWPSTGTSTNKDGGVILVLWPQTSPLSETMR